MTRLRYDGLTAVLGAALPASGAGATAMTFDAALIRSGGVAVPTITGSDYIPLSILDVNGRLAEIVYLTAYTAGATTGTVTRAQEGTTAAARAAGLKVVHGPTAADMAAGTNPVTFRRRAPTPNADFNITSQAFTALDTAFDLTVPAKVGDVIQTGLTGRLANAGDFLSFDVASIVGGAIANRYAGGATDGVPSGLNNGGNTGINVMTFWTVQASDLSATGTVTLRWYARTTGAAHTMYSRVDIPVDFWAVNTTLNGGPGPGQSASVLTSCRFTGSQSASSANTETPVTFTTEVSDPLNMHDTATNTSRFTVPAGRGGDYYMIGELDIHNSSGVGGLWDARLRKNGTTFATVQGPQNNFTKVQVAAMDTAVAGDFYELAFISGASITIQAATFQIRPL